MIGSKELAKKKKDGEAADEKVNCKKSKVLLCGCVSIFYNGRGLIFIPHANTILADYDRVRFYSRESRLLLKIR